MEPWLRIIAAGSCSNLSNKELIKKYMKTLSSRLLITLPVKLRSGVRCLKVVGVSPGCPPPLESNTTVRQAQRILVDLPTGTILLSSFLSSGKLVSSDLALAGSFPFARSASTVSSPLISDEPKSVGFQKGCSTKCTQTSDAL